MASITREQLVELREKYLRGLRSLDLDIERLKSDRIATEGAVQAIATLIDDLGRQSADAKPQTATD
jgi:hypothetical protein